jgi:hypothetical protein
MKVENNCLELEIKHRELECDSVFPSYKYWLVNTPSLPSL